LLKASGLFESAVSKIRDLEEEILPNELPNIAKFREIFLKSNEIQEKAEEGYQKKLKEIDNQSEDAIIGAKKEVEKWKNHIPNVDRGIQEWHDIETKAWELIIKSL
jgi:hypothetical protein